MKFIKRFSVFESTPEMSSDPQVFLKDQKISPDFIPHEKFHRHKWLIPKSGRNKWYYQEESNGILSSSLDSEFKETLDPLIREAVEILHKKGIPTTPSCSGHFSEDSHYDKVYEDLVKECGEIRSTGILMMDPQTKEEILLKDPDYILPWGKGSFIEKAREHGKIGVLGFHDPHRKYFNKLEESRIPHSQILRDGDISIFIVSPIEENDLAECWGLFTSSVSSV